MYIWLDRKSDLHFGKLIGIPLVRFSRGL